MKKPGSHIYVDENGGWPEVAIVPLPSRGDQMHRCVQTAASRGAKNEGPAYILNICYSGGLLSQ